MTGDPPEECASAFASCASSNAAEVSADVADTIVDHLIRNGRQFPDGAAFTFVDFTADSAGRRETVTWSELGRRVDALTGVLMASGVTGERVAVVAPQGIGYVVGFLAALRAGAVAVPLFAPHTPGRDERLASALADSQPTCLLTTADAKPGVTEFCTVRRLAEADRIIAVDCSSFSSGAPETIEAGLPILRSPADCAYLQYTSGSTRTPAGVEITHANLVANVRQAVAAFDIHRDRNQVVSWLPLFHDMGLVLAIAIPVLSAAHSVVMDPLAFVQRPARWLHLLAEHKGAVTAAPNFAFDYCVRRASESLGPGTALRDVAVMINGSEPIRPGTLARFQQAFGPSGLIPETMRPSYGLAEATVFVSTSRSGTRPQITSFDQVMLRQGVLRPVTGSPAEGVPELVACGPPAGQDVAVVNAMTGCSLPEGEVGEIWVRGPNVARGYWRNPVRSAETFGARVANPPPDGHADGHADGRADGAWLRTGDLGALHDGCLYVTGRIKDLIIIDGTNHYPQDIESTAQESHTLIRYDHVAAFSMAHDGEERLVVIAEHSRHVTDPGSAREAAERSVREAVQREHGVAVHDFVLAPPGTVPRTTSGKVARDACRRHYLSGGWSPRAQPDLARAGEAE